MGFDKPQPFIYATGNFGEQVRRVGVIQLVRLIDGIARFMSKSGQRFGDGFDVRHAIGNRERILFQPRARRRHPHGAFSDAAQWHDAFGDHIHVGLHVLVHLVEKFVQAETVVPIDR